MLAMQQVLESSPSVQIPVDNPRRESWNEDEQRDRAGVDATEVSAVSQGFGFGGGLPTSSADTRRPTPPAIKWRDMTRRRLHELRNQLLDLEDEGLFDKIGEERLADVEEELRGLDAADIAHAQRHDALWERIDALAAMVLANSPMNTAI
jgi:hypothetical protein